MDQRPLDTGTLSDITQEVNNSQSQTLSRNSNKRSSFQNLDRINLDDSPSNTTMSGRERPRYMTPTLASKAQNNTVLPHSRPMTPASAGSGTEKRNWIANAGRRMGLTTPKSKRGDRQADKPSTDEHSRDVLTGAPKEMPVSFPSLSMISHLFPAAGERQEQQGTRAANHRRQRSGSETRPNSHPRSQHE